KIAEPVLDQGHGDDGSGLGPQDARAERDEARAARSHHLQLIIAPAAFGADAGNDRLSVAYFTERFVDRQAAALAEDQQDRRRAFRLRRSDEISERQRRLNRHKAAASRLFQRFERDAPPAFGPLLCAL